MSLFRKLLALASVTFAISVAQANPIGGEISFKGVITLNGTIANATSLTFWTGLDGMKVSGATASGSYAGVSNQSVTGGLGGTGGTLTFAPFLSPDPATIWSFTDAGTGLTYDFILAGTINVQRGIGLTLSGWGTAQITGYDDTPGFWSLTTQGTNSTVTFSSSTTVPDTAATLILLGAGLLLVGFAGYRRNCAV